MKMKCFALLLLFFWIRKKRNPFPCFSSFSWTFTVWTNTVLAERIANWQHMIDCCSSLVLLQKETVPILWCMSFYALVSNNSFKYCIRSLLNWVSNDAVFLFLVSSVIRKWLFSLNAILFFISFQKLT